MSIININTWFSLKNDLFNPQLRGFGYASWINIYIVLKICCFLFLSKVLCTPDDILSSVLFRSQVFFFFFHGEKFWTLVNCMIFAKFKKSSSLFLFPHFARGSFSENLKSLSLLLVAMGQFWRGKRELSRCVNFFVI